EAATGGLSTLDEFLELEGGTGLAERVKGLVTFVIGPTLRRGDSGPAVLTLQRGLAALGLAVAIDGRFGPGTERAVRSFQVRTRISVDGRVGPTTKAALAAALTRSGRAPAPAP